jgi:hypothetical protein
MVCQEKNSVHHPKILKGMRKGEAYLNSEALPSRPGAGKPMKIERKAFHRKDTGYTEMIHFFSLPLTPQDRLRYLRDRGRRQRKMVMPFPPVWKAVGLEARQGLINPKSLREALGLSLFC